MIVYLSSMSWPCTRSIWKVKDVILKNTSYGLMGVLHNSKVQKHSTMLPCIHILWPKGVQMCWNFFASSHKNGKVDNVCALFKWEICKGNQTTSNKATKCTWCCHFLLTMNMYNIAHHYYLRSSWWCPTFFAISLCIFRKQSSFPSTIRWCLVQGIKFSYSV
jgi:hypothetical protein